MVLRVNGFWEAVWVIWRLFRGKDDPAHIRRFRGTRIRIQALEDEQPAQLDGEAGLTTPLEATIRAGALTVLVPE